MRTFWTAPNRGATLAELAQVFPDNKKLPQLMEEFGADKKSGLGLVEDGKDTELDALRLNSDTFMLHLTINA